MHYDHCPPPAALIPSVSVPYEVRTSHAEPRALAAVRGTATREQLGTGIIRMLDLVWPVLRRAYAALDRWLADHGRRPAGVSWEIYGDWEDDPAKRRTDVYFLLEPEAV